MHIEQLMTRPVAHCGRHSTLADVARVMWNEDCGFVAIADMEEGRLVGVITDRDICMAALSRGMPLYEIPVEHAMARHVVTVRPEEDVRVALDKMAEHQVRRLPVVDAKDALVGVISLNDVIDAAAHDGHAAEELQRPTIETLARVGAHRIHVPACA